MKRNNDETFEDYRKRRESEKRRINTYLRGRLVFVDGSEKCIVWVTAIIASGVIILASLMALYEISVDTTALKNGYREGAIPGRAGTAWVKQLRSGGKLTANKR